MSDELISELIEAPARARRLYPRGGFEGLEPNAAQVLVVLAGEAAATVDAIADRLALDPSTVRHALGVLRDRGLAAERPDPDDRRRKRNAATAAGRACLSRLLRRAAGSA